jgi:hypothetical protein
VSVFFNHPPSSPPNLLPDLLGRIPHLPRPPSPSPPSAYPAYTRSSRCTSSRPRLGPQWHPPFPSAHTGSQSSISPVRLRRRCSWLVAVVGRTSSAPTASPVKPHSTPPATPAGVPCYLYRPVACSASARLRWPPKPAFAHANPRCRWHLGRQQATGEGWTMTCE